MPVHPWMFWACLIICIVLHYCIDLTCMLHLPLLSTMSTSYCHSLHLPICLCCYCIMVLSCIIAFSWIVLLHCIVLLHISLSLQWVPVYISSPHPHVCLCDCISLAGRTIYLYCYCVLLLAYCHWHWHLLLIICLLPQLLRAVAPALTLIISFKLRHVWCLPPIVDWLLADCAVASVALSLISISGFLNYFPI